MTRPAASIHAQWDCVSASFLSTPGRFFLRPCSVVAGFGSRCRTLLAPARPSMIYERAAHDEELDEEEALLVAGDSFVFMGGGDTVPGDEVYLSGL